MALPVDSQRGTEATATPSRTPGQLSDKVRSLRIKAPPPPAPSSKLPWFLVTLLASGTGYLGYELWNLKQAEAARAAQATAENAAANATAASQATPVAINTGSSATTATSGGVVHESKGYLIARRQILISPKVGGMVKSLRVHSPRDPETKGETLIEGMQVHKGDILAELETTDYEADMLRAKASLASSRLRFEMERKNLPREIERAKSELAEAITQRDFLKGQLDRWNKLSKTSTVSPSDIEKAQSDFEGAGHRVDRLRRALDLITEPQEQRLAVAESEVEAAMADLSKAEWRLSNTVIVSPVTGTVLKKNVEEGNIVNPGAFNGSYSICDLADLADLEVELDIQERDISRIFVGQKCVIRAEAFQEHPYDGYVSRLMPIANRSKGAIPVRVKVLIPEDLVGIHLKPEMGAIVAFYKKTESEPAQASTPRGAANANAATEPESPGEVATNAEPASEQPGEPPPESENR
ncbi:MAG: HlyD family secretion protein [Planctomycetaceae bacterium]